MARRSDSADSSAVDAANAAAAEEAEAAAGTKGRPTPTRREREAANKRPIVPTDRKAAAKADREASAQRREQARLGMAAGDDRYLTARDKGPQRRFTRDYIDARWSVGEFLIPIVVVLLIMTFLPSHATQAYALVAVWGYFAITVIDCIVVGFRISGKLRAKYGTSERGIMWYAAMRSVQLRVMRLPKPQVKRGDFPA